MLIINVTSLCWFYRTWHVNENVPGLNLPLKMLTAETKTTCKDAPAH